MSKKKQAEYEVLARWRNGWHLIKLGDQCYLRRAFRGQYKVNAVKSGFAMWRITDPQSGEVVHPDRLK